MVRRCLAAPTSSPDLDQRAPDPEEILFRHSWGLQVIVGESAGPLQEDHSLAVCSFGANATVVCGVTIGRYAFIAAGAVVVNNVPDYALMVGVPARQAGWMSRHGIRLPRPNADVTMVCPESGLRYKEMAKGILRCLDLDEEAPLPADLCTGKRVYDDIVHGRGTT